jgi:hypothetical protein
VNLRPKEPVPPVTSIDFPGIELMFSELLLVRWAAS